MAGDRCGLFYVGHRHSPRLGTPLRHLGPLRATLLLARTGVTARRALRQGVLRRY
jgi:hypothetical protein